MKPNARLRSFLIASSAVLAIHSSQAAQLYWDGGTVNIGTNGNGVSTGTSGDWDNTLGENTLNWDQGAGLAHVAWTNANLDTAYFGAATGGTVTLTDPITVGGLGFFSNSSYTIAAGTEGLTFGAATNHVRMLNVSGLASTATISGTVTSVSGGNLVFTSVAPDVTSTLTFSGISAGGWSGTTTINQNTVIATTSTSGSINQVLNSTSGITLNGGTIQFNRATNANLNAISDSAAITVNGGGTFTANSSDAGGASANETIGAVTVNSGQFNLNWVNNPSSGGNIVLSGFTRSGGSSALTVSFGANGRFINSAVSTNTAAAEIIGPWATTGGANGIGLQTDYAIYTGGNGTFAARNIAASAESTWSASHAATSNFTMSAIDSATISGGGRNLNTLRSLNNGVTVTASSPNITLTGHTLAVGDVVTFSAATMPTGLTAGTPYYVVATAANTIQVSATAGGGAITPTTAGTTVVASGAVQVSSGNNFGTFGILNGSATTLNILQSGGAGSVTLPTTAAGNLFVTTGSGAINISAPIINNTGALTLVKNGAGGTLTLSGTNTYTGGTVLNAGTLAIGNVANIGGAGAGLTFGGTATLAPSAALNFSSGTLTVNSGAVGTITGSGATAFATTTGTGTLRYTSAANSNSLNLGDASGFTGNLEFRLTGNANYGQGATVIQFSSLGDSSGSVLQVGGGQSDATAPGQRATITFTGASAPLTFNNRVVEILPRNGSNHTVNTTALQNNNASASNTWIINTNLSSQVSDARSLELSGSNTGANAFNGVISDGNNGGSILLRKDGAGTWTISGNNTHSGGTTLTAGKLNVNGAAALGTGTFTWGAATLDNTSGSAITNANNNAIAWNGDGTFTGSNALDLGTGNVTLGGNRQPVVNGTGTLTVGGVVSGAFGITLGGSGTLALTNEASTYTGKTVVGNNASSSLKLRVTKLADLSATSSLGAPTTAANGLIQLGNTSNGSTLELIGSSGPSSTNRQIQIGSSSTGSGAAAIVNNNTNPAYTLTFTNAAFNVAATGVNGFNRTLTLSGTNTGDNTISGAIIPNTGTSGTTALAKTGTGTWVLAGANTYTGDTSITDGILKAGANDTIPSGSGKGNVNLNGGASSAGTLDLNGFNLAINGLSGTSNTVLGKVVNNATGTARTLTVGNNNATSSFAGVIADNTSGTGTVALTKTGTGTLTLTGTSTYTGATTVNAGVLAINGSLANTSTTVGNTATLRGSGGTAGSVTVQNGGTIAAGNSIESLATGSLTLDAGSTFAYEIDNDALAAVAGDLTAVTGTLDIAGGAILTISELGAGSWTIGEKLTLISYSGSWNAGLFTYLGGALADDSTITFSGMDWLFNYNDTGAGSNYTGDLTGSGFVTMTAVPEPRAALLGGLGLLMLVLRRRD